MEIWKQKITDKDFTVPVEDTIHESLNIKVTQIGDDFIEGTMPVDRRTKQPAGILHGGASVVLAESLGSLASNMLIDRVKHFAVGQSITANHIRPATEGTVTARAEPLHIGKKSHVWTIKVRNDAGKLVCYCTLTTAVIDKP